MKFILLLSVAVLAVLPSVLSSPRCYNRKKTVAFTNYWISKEGTTDMDNDGNTMHLSGPKNTRLKDVKGRTIAMVAKKTFEKCQMEGTCLLENGKMVNLDSGKNTFMPINRRKMPYGQGSTDTSGLDPFVSIATNDLPQKSTVYVKELDGVKLPNGKIHNGCLRVDDTGWSFEGCQLDWFVLEYQFYVKLNTPEHVHAVARKCKPLNYITKSIQQWSLL